MRRVEEISDGAVRMGPGTMYGTINRLLADGLIEETTHLRTRDDVRCGYWAAAPGCSGWSRSHRRTAPTASGTC
jgi:hypothetical protein